ncbi:MAG TPA: hypothetical protein VHG91_09115, partial [Longimicrobium sp.]|nr:hypothetical protein [Longimicrobium sp.]
MRLPEGTGRGVRVGVVDSGWDRALADPRVRPGVAIVVPEGGGAPELSDDDHDRMGHGTACADLVLRVSPEAEVV